MRINVPNVIIVDADYVDKVAFNLIVNFERIIGRRIPPADMARWIDCIALDGGIRNGHNEVQIILLHSKNKKEMDNFTPSSFAEELDGKAFKDNLGEFLISSLPVEGDMVDMEHLFCDSLMHICDEKDVRRVMAVPDCETYYDGVRHAARGVCDERVRLTVFTMESKAGGNFRQEILGYSLMSALGIRGDEIPR